MADRDVCGDRSVHPRSWSCGTGAPCCVASCLRPCATSQRTVGGGFVQLGAGAAHGAERDAPLTPGFPASSAAGSVLLRLPLAVIARCDVVRGSGGHGRMDASFDAHFYQETRDADLDGLLVKVEPLSDLAVGQAFSE